MRQITLTNSVEKTTVDESDFEFLSQWKWFKSKTGYAYSKGGRVSMHRLICISNALVDHADGNKLNNQRANLRVCNRSQNAMNAVKRAPATSKFKGVSWHKAKRKWRANIWDGRNKKHKHLGLFTNEIDAASAYNSAARMLCGEFARPNVI